MMENIIELAAVSVNMRAVAILDKEHNLDIELLNAQTTEFATQTDMNNAMKADYLRFFQRIKDETTDS